MALTKVSRGLLSTGIVDNSNATAITLNADESATFAGGISVTGVLTATSLDISGDIDVDGVANLDVVDIDGAVGMASTLNVTGAATLTSTLAVTGKITADAGIDIDNINIDGTTIALSSGALTLDVAGDILIDTGANIQLRSSGTEFGRLFQSSADFYIYNPVSDKDVVIYGNDGGSAFEALRLDMSAAGAATFNSTVSATHLTATNGVLNLDDNGSHNGIINSPASLFVNIDSDGTNTGELFAIAKDRTSTSGGTELFRVQEDGSVGIGTSSITNPYSQTPFTDVNIDGTWGGVISFKLGGVTKGWVGQRSSGNEDMVIGATAGQELLFYANNLEAARINTSRHLLIGKTAVTATGFGTELRGNQIIIGKTSSGTVNGIFFNHNSSYVGGLNYTDSATSLATGSDERLKSGIQDADDAGSKIDAIQVRQFDWKVNGSHQDYGFIAQELEPVFAHAVHTAQDDFKTKGVDLASLVPMLVKEIQSLRARVAQLEA